MMKLGRNEIIIILLIVVGVATVFSLRSGTVGEFFSGQSASKNVYYCPMHPTYTSDRPGSCPICNMSLVKRKPEKSEESSDSMNMKRMQDLSGMSMENTEHAGHTAGGSMTSSEMGGMKTFTVEELMKMKPGEICLLHKCKHGTCMLAMTEEAARLGKCPHCGEDLGVIVKNAIPEGHAPVKLGTDNQLTLGIETAPVKKMALVKTIRTVGRIAYDPELYQAEEEYLQAIQASRKAETAVPEIKEQAAKLVDSSKIKLRLLGLSDKIVQEIEQAGKPDRSLLYSDAGGKVWLYAPIYEYELPFVKVGDDIDAEVPARAGEKFKGTIRSIDSVIDSTTRSVRVRAVLDNPEGILKPEMYVNASLQVDLGENVAVSKEAVFMTGENNIVFISVGGGRYEPRQVILGAEADNFYQVKNGLQEGELVVTSGNFLIDSESRLKSALSGTGGRGHNHGA